MNRRAFALLVPAAAAGFAADTPAERIELALERQAEGRWARVDPQTVLSAGERIRFRFSTNTPGWLCVYYTGSGGQSEWLLPSRLVVKDTPYLVPAEPASFSVDGPPGMDVLYWILSPKQVPLESLVPAGAKRTMPNTLIPRCRSQSVVMACLDDRAGPAPLDTASSPLRQSRLRARELKIDSGSNGASIQPAERNIGVIVYEFRLAHR
jgi:hypothetical protein